MGLLAEPGLRACSCSTSMGLLAVPGLRAYSSSTSMGFLGPPGVWWGLPVPAPELELVSDPGVQRLPLESGLGGS